MSTPDHAAHVKSPTCDAAQPSSEQERRASRGVVLQAGRYGSFAFGLALAAAVAAGHGVANAETSDSQSTSSSQQSSGSASDGAESSGGGRGTVSDRSSTAGDDDTGANSTAGLDDKDDDDTGADATVEDEDNTGDDIDDDEDSADDDHQTDGNQVEEEDDSDIDRSASTPDHSTGRSTNPVDVSVYSRPQDYASVEPSGEVALAAAVDHPAEEKVAPVVELDLPDASAFMPLDTVVIDYRSLPAAVPMMVAAPLQQPVEVPFFSVLLEQGYILNGTETTVANATLTNITYSADISVTRSDGTDRGYLRADNVKIVNQLSMVGVIESSLDGNYLVMGTPVL